MVTVQDMRDFHPFNGRCVVIKNDKGELITGPLEALCYVGKTRGSIGKAYVGYRKRNGLRGHMGIHVFPGKTQIDLMNI